MSESGYQPPTMPPKTFVPRIDVSASFNLPKKTAVLLHPRRAHVADPFASKMGGNIAWSRSTPWPTCKEHGDTVIPILQLRKDDIPELGFPDQTDLFHLLWCPHDHEELVFAPKTMTFWHVANEIGEILERINPSFDMFVSNCVPKECKLYTERMEETRQDIDDAETWEAINAYIVEHAQGDFDTMGVPAFERDSDSYEAFFSASPGTKVGGYCYWIQDPYFPRCECEREMEHLLTVASSDVGDGSNWYRWAPSDIARDGHAFASFLRERERGSTLCIGDLGTILVFVCRHCPGYPTVGYMQSG